MERLLRIAQSTLLILALVLPLAAAGPSRAQVSDDATPPPDATQLQATLALLRSPLLFIENVGQFDSRARFQIRGGQYTTWLAEDGIRITLVEPQEESDLSTQRDAMGPSAMQGESSQPRSGVNLRLSFEGANPAPKLVPFARSETIISYFTGNDPSDWRPDVPVWEGVRYVDLYPGLDLEVSSVAGRWAWRMVAKGTASQQASALAAVRLRVDGADSLSVVEGALRLDTAAGEFTVPLLQLVDVMGVALTLPQDSLHLSANAVVMPFATESQSRAVIQTGGLVYSTYLGGSSEDAGNSIAVDEAGQAYITGYTYSSEYPTTTGVFTTTFGGGNIDAFVTVLNATGNALVFSTFLGGDGDEYGYGIAVDEDGRAYVTGYTTSSGYPTATLAFDTTYGGDGDVFVTVLNPTGTALVYSTFLGGSSQDVGYDIAVYGDGQAYVTGYTQSSGYPTTTLAFDPEFNGGDYDAFVSVLNPAGTNLVYSTFLGGSANDISYSIAIDGMGQAFITGETRSSNYPTSPGAFNTTESGISDTFVSVLNPTGTALVYSTFLGGSSADNGRGIALDEDGQAYITGETSSTDYPITPGAADATINGVEAFVSVLNATGTGLVYSTFLGGSNTDVSYGIAVDGAGYAYVTGLTHSWNYPTTPGALATGFNGDGDAFVSVLNPTGTALIYSTYLGGTWGDHGTAIAVDGAGRAFVTGYASSTNFPTTPGAFNTSFNGYVDCFVSVFQVLNYQVAIPLVQR